MVFSIYSLIKKTSPERAFGLRRHWIKYIGHPILNIHVEVEGQPISSPALYVCNHRSFADPVVVCRYLDAYVIAKAEVASYPVINKGAELTGVLYVKREDKTSRDAVRDMMINTIKKGYNVLIYPEGTVGVNSKTLPFKSGSFIEAANNDIIIVPVAIEYRVAEDLWLIPNFIKQYLVQFAKWRTDVKLCFGPPIVEKDGMKAKEMAQEWIDNKKAEMRVNWCKIDFSKYDHKAPLYQTPKIKS